MMHSLSAAARIAPDPARDFRTAWLASLGLGLLLLAAVAVAGRQAMLSPLVWLVGMFLPGLHLVRRSWRCAGTASDPVAWRVHADAAVLLAAAWAIAVPLLAQEADQSLCFLLAGVLSGAARFIRPLVAGEPLRLRICAGLLGLPMLILLLQAGTPLDYLLAALVLAHVLMFLAVEGGEFSRLPELEAGLERAQRDGRARCDFMVAAAGEMRPAVHAILGVLQGTGAGDGPPPADGRDRLRVAARHLLGLLDAVSDIARADADANVASLDVDRVALEEIVGYVVARHAPAAAGRGTQLQVGMAELPAYLIGDAARLTHALHSLVAQGLGPTRNGCIVLEVSGVRESRLGVLVEFRLGGCALDLAPEQIAQLMQDSAPGGPQFGAFGLRLLHLRHLAAQMGGDAGVLAEEGAGVTVWFSAWLARQGGRVPPAVPMRGAAG